MSINSFYNTCTNEYNNNTGVYTPDNNRTVSFQGVLKFDLQYTESNFWTTEFFNNAYSGSGALPNEFKATVELYLMERIGSNYEVKEKMLLDFTDVAKANRLENPTTDLNGNTIPYSTGEISVINGREYYLSVGAVEYSGVRLYSNRGNIQRDYLNFKNFDDFTFTLKEDSTFGNQLIDKEIKAGDTMETNLVVPKEIKQSDLLSSIIKRFNLYIDYDLIDDKKLIIETREDFLTDERVNIEPLVDRSRDYVIKPLGALDAGRFIFKDQLDKDYLNDAYNKVNDEVYGQVTIDVQNDFLNSDKTISTIFAPTPLETQKGVNDRVLSSMRFVNENKEQVEATAKIRLLYYGGLLDTQQTWFLEPVFPFLSVQNQYPYAGHLDNPYNPTFDLNWFIPKQLYYDFSYGNKYTLNYSNNNCYNIYWKKYIEEITDRNSKILECFLALRPQDYRELNFRDNYYIDGSYWRLLKITDFDAIAEQTTKCTFLKVEPKNTFVPELKFSRGGKNTYADGSDLPTEGMFRRPNSNSGKQQDTLQFGDNVKGGTRSIIASNNIVQSLNAKNALITGSDDSKIFSDNVAIINSPGTIARRPNESYINGLFVEKLESIFIPNEVLEDLISGVDIMPPLPADEFYEITRGYVRLNGSATDGGTHKVSIITNDALGHPLANIPVSFFGTDDNAAHLELDAHAEKDIHFGSGLKLASNNNMSFPEGTTLTINLVYRIIKL